MQAHCVTIVFVEFLAIHDVWMTQVCDHEFFFGGHIVVISLSVEFSLAYELVGSVVYGVAFQAHFLFGRPPTDGQVLERVDEPAKSRMTHVCTRYTALENKPWEIGTC